MDRTFKLSEDFKAGDEVILKVASIRVDGGNVEIHFEEGFVVLCYKGETLASPYPAADSEHDPVLEAAIRYDFDNAQAMFDSAQDKRSLVEFFLESSDKIRDTGGLSPKTDKIAGVVNELRDQVRILTDQIGALNARITELETH